MNKRIRVLMLSCVTLLLALGLVVATTFALFTDSVRIKNHLQAGELTVELYRTNLTSKRLNNKGVLEDATPNTAKVSFTDATDKNVFDLASDELIVPQSEFEATMLLENKGDVAINYWLEVEITVPAGTENAALAQQITFVFTPESGSPITQHLGDGTKIDCGTSSAPIAKVEIGKSVTFKVKISFDDNNTVNNNAQAGELSFDLVVYAWQAVN